MVKELPPTDAPAQSAGDRARQQVSAIAAVHTALDAAGIPAWLFGGWGLDVHIGRITRDHGDVEFWVERTSAERSTEVLVACGATALATQPPEESCEFTWNGVQFSIALFDRRSDGSFTPQGRWSDWTFPPDSFGDDLGLLEGDPVRVMSVAGMVAMKEQFPTLRKGRPWRPKDIEDLANLRLLQAR